jgi:DNA-binding NarL/FixJ family response regulator
MARCCSRVDKIAKKRNDELIHVIRSMAAGEVIFGASIAARIATLFGAPPVDELTTRERQIFDLLCTEMSTVAIARRLTLAPKTIRNNLSSIFAKLRVTDRAEAIASVGEGWVAAG